MVRRSSGRRSDYQWSNFGDLESNQDLGVTGGVFGATALGSLEAQTVVRVRGKVGGQLDATAVDERVLLLLGLTIVNTELFEQGVGAAPEIFSGAGVSDEASWLWTGALWLTSGAESAVNTNSLFDSTEVDTKAMRKMKAHESLVFVFQSPAELVLDQAGTFDLAWWFHVLAAS